MIKFENVSVTYPGGVEALKDLDLEINEGDFIIMAVGGPNSRKDFHVDSREEFFFQIEGDMLLEVFEAGKRKKILIREGELFLLPKNVPHSPQRFKDTIGLVIEYKRDKGV